MFDRIFDFIASVWEWLIPFVVIDAYEEGIILRLGIWNRNARPGFVWLWPLGFEVCKYETVVRQTAYLDPQSLTSKDGKSVTVAAIVIFEITNIRKFLLDIDEGETDMSNMVYGIVSDSIEDTNWADVRGKKFNRKVWRQCRNDCNTYCGVNVIAIKWSDKAAARSIRLWND